MSHCFLGTKRVQRSKSTGGRGKGEGGSNHTPWKSIKYVCEYSVSSWMKFIQAIFTITMNNIFNLDFAAMPLPLISWNLSPVPLPPLPLKNVLNTALHCCCSQSRPQWYTLTCTVSSAHTHTRTCVHQHTCRRSPRSAGSYELIATSPSKLLGPPAPPPPP